MSSTIVAARTTRAAIATIISGVIDATISAVSITTFAPVSQFAPPPPLLRNTFHPPNRFNVFAGVDTFLDI